MIMWFIDNLKPSYYKKMISAQVTHFASLIPIREHIDEGIRSKKIVDLEGKETDIHMIAMAPKSPRGSTSAYATPIA